MFDRGETTVERELERIAEQPAADVGLPDAGDAGAPFDDLVLVHDRHVPRLEQRDVDVAVGIGVMLERDPHRHVDVRSSSGAQFTRFVVSRTDGCSTISTIATMYGSSGPGIHG